MALRKTIKPPLVTTQAQVGLVRTDPAGHPATVPFADVSALIGAGPGDVIGPSSSVDGQGVLFDGVTGKKIKGATGTGFVRRASGVDAVTELSGDATTSGSGAVTLASTGVTPGTYGDATHVARVTVDAKGRITAASSVAIVGGGGGGAWIPVALGTEPLTFVSDGAGRPVLVAYP